MRDILRIFWRFRGRATLGVLCLLVTDACQLAVPLVVKGVVDGLVERKAGRGWLVQQAFLLVGLALLIALFRFAWRLFFFSMARRAELDLRNRILDHALTLTNRFFSRTRTGEFMALATNDVESVRRALAMGFVAGFDGTVFALVAVAAMLWLDPVLALWTILPLPFLALLMAFSLKAFYRRWDAVQASFEAITEKARESISGMRVLRAYDRGGTDLEAFKTLNGAFYKTYMRYVRVDALFHPAILFLAGSCMALLLGVGGLRVLEGETTMGTFVAFVAYLGRLTWPMIAAGWMLSLVQRAAASMDRINALLDVRDGEDRAGTAPPREARGEITARELTFTYSGESPVLRSVSLHVPAGGSLGIVGEVGSGKSTLANLLVRMFDPPEGRLLLDDRDIRAWSIDDLRRSVAFVPQEAFLFSDTVFGNLRVGKADATMDEAREACRVAAVDGEIMALPDGYHTLLGERGITLSGGQKQRLCLARALLKKAPILVLDDTLSAVDAETEAAILSSLGARRGQQTLFVISHRVSAVRELDAIISLRRGRIAQRGTHAELAAVPGLYRDMVRLQEMAG